MKLSEKTLELNICAQVAQHFGSQKLFWFGLTQQQEAVAGFDACVRLGGRLFIFQFKASNRVLKSGERVFLAPDYQLKALRKQVSANRRSVFYAFPLLGTTAEFKADPDLPKQTLLADVATLSGVGPPTKSNGAPRKNDCHNVYVKPGSVVFHSDPFEAEAIQLNRLISKGFPGADGIGRVFEQNAHRFWEYARHFTAGARGLVIW